MTNVSYAIKVICNVRNRNADSAISHKAQVKPFFSIKQAARTRNRHHRHTTKNKTELEENAIIEENDFLVLLIVTLKH